VHEYHDPGCPVDVAGVFVQEVEWGVIRGIEGFSNKAKELCCGKAIPAFGVDDNRKVRHVDNVFMAVGLYIIRSGCFVITGGGGLPHHFKVQHTITFLYQI
jgi:hypothetical protein